MQGKRGALSVKRGGPDLPEFGSRAEYVGAARTFHSGAPGPGVVRKGGDFVRFDPSAGQFGIRSAGGRIKTFFRPDNGMSYFRSQFK